MNNRSSHRETVAACIIVVLLFAVLTWWMLSMASDTVPAESEPVTVSHSETAADDDGDPLSGDSYAEAGWTTEPAALPEPSHGETAGAGADGGAAGALPECPTEDSDKCQWNAATRGNGAGESFVIRDGVRTVTP